MLDLSDWDQEEVIRFDSNYLKPFFPWKLSNRLSLLILNFNLIQLRAIGNPIVTGIRNKKGLLVEANKAEDIRHDFEQYGDDHWSLERWFNNTKLIFPNNWKNILVGTHKLSLNINDNYYYTDQLNDLINKEIIQVFDLSNREQENILKPLLEEQVEAIILGCSHYPSISRHRVPRASQAQATLATQR